MKIDQNSPVAQAKLQLQGRLGGIRPNNIKSLLQRLFGEDVINVGKANPTKALTTLVRLRFFLNSEKAVGAYDLLVPGIATKLLGMGAKIEKWSNLPDLAKARVLPNLALLLRASNK